MTLTFRLLWLVAIALLPALAIQAYNEIDLRRSREAEVRSQALQQAQLAASELNQIVGGVGSLLTVVAAVPAVRNLDTPGCVAFLRDLQPRVPHLRTIFAADLDGRVVCTSGQMPPPDVRIADRSYFRAALATAERVTGEYTESKQSKTPILPIAMPLHDGTGRTVGVVGAALDLGWLSRHLQERSLPAGDSVTIADRNGIILARAPLPEKFVGTPIPATYQHLLHEPEPGSLDILSQDGTRRVLGYIPVDIPPLQGIYVSAGVGAEHAFASVNRATLRGIAMIVLGLVGGGVAAWLIGRRFFLEPMRALLLAARRWRSGDYASRSGIAERSGEFGVLGAEFDAMVDAIAAWAEERDKALQDCQDSEARLLAVVESLPFEFWVIDPDGRYVLQNSASRRAWGDRIGQLPSETESPRALVESWETNNRRALSGEIVRAEQSWEANGQVRHVEKIIAPILAGTRLLGAVGLNIDVTERYEAEQRQRLLVTELNHRVRNMLATVAGVVRLTLTDGRPLEEARDALSERLKALAATYELLSSGNWQGRSSPASPPTSCAPMVRRRGSKAATSC